MVRKKKFLLLAITVGFIGVVRKLHNVFVY